MYCAFAMLGLAAAGCTFECRIGNATTSDGLPGHGAFLRDWKCRCGRRFRNYGALTMHSSNMSHLLTQAMSSLLLIVSYCIVAENVSES
jgi:hypothetical protein